MDKYGEELKGRINEFRDLLSQHEVLNEFWPRLSLILKGSVARGNADKYSDLDFVFYCDQLVRQEIIQKYFNKGLIKRTNGLFIHFPKGIGHYSIESYETLEHYFETRNFAQIWECQNILIITDPNERYQTIIQTHSESLFTNILEDIKGKYLQTELLLDWMRHPLQRGDEVSAVIHGGKILECICQLSYLLDQKPYPHAKWISFYLETTTFGKLNYQKILKFSRDISSKKELPKHLPLFFYSQYRDGKLLCNALAKKISELYGDQPWIKEWYNFV